MKFFTYALILILVVVALYNAIMLIKAIITKIKDKKNNKERRDS